MLPSRALDNLESIGVTPRVRAFFLQMDRLARSQAMRKRYDFEREGWLTAGTFPLAFSGMFFYCSNVVKSRNLTDIRARAAMQTELLRARAALRRPWASASHGWHEAFLDAFVRGETITAAAASAGVSRNAVYWAREHVPGFEYALRLTLAARGSTMKRNRSTKIRDDVARTLPTGAVQNAPPSTAPENMAANMRNLFPLAEESAIFASPHIPNREAACP